MKINVLSLHHLRGTLLIQNKEQLRNVSIISPNQKKPNHPRTIFFFLQLILKVRHSND